jgi:hypothetical protein
MGRRRLTRQAHNKEAAMSKFLTVAKNYLDPEVEEELQNRLSHMETCVAEWVRAGQGKKALRELKGALT